MVLEDIIHGHRASLSYIQRLLRGEGLVWLGQVGEAWFYTMPKV